MKNITLSLIATMLLGFVNLLSAQQTSNPQSGNIKTTPVDRLSPEDELKKLQQLFNENQLSHAAHQHKKGDGKSQHFRLTKDINDIANSSPRVLSSYLPNPTFQFPVAGNIAYFTAEDGIHGIELWRTDGTSAGTYIVKDINPGEMGTAMINMVAINGKIYFSASRDGYNFFPWVSDGTASGTFAIDSTETGRSSIPQRFAGLNDGVYIGTGGNGIDFGGLTKVNEGLNGFTFLKPLKDAAYWDVRELTVAGGLLYFTAYSYARGLALWRTDGTDAGTYKLTDLNIGRGAINYLTAYNNKLYFLFADPTGYKLGVSDGTVTGTGLAPGNNGIVIPPENFYENHFPVMNNVLFLSGNNQAGQNGLYKYDAANPDGLVLVKNIFFGVDNGLISNYGFEVGNNTLYFLVSNPSTGIRQLWRSDGTEAGTTNIRSFDPTEFISPFHFYLGNLYFVLHDPIHGSEIWKSDGTANGTAIIKDINPGPDNSVSIQLTESNGRVVFIANEFKSKTGIELWVTDGTAAGTKLLKDINTRRTESSNPMDGPPPAALKDKLVFAATEDVHGRELYISDGTKKGTRLLNDIKSGATGSSPGFFYAKNDEVYFLAHPIDFSHATIYKTNGKPQGLKKIVTYESVPDRIVLKVTDKGLVFYVLQNQVSHDYELWRTNGSTSGTFKIANKLSFELLIETVGNTVYFITGDNITGSELWKSDGSTAGTKKIWNSPAFIYKIFPFRNHLYFVTTDDKTSLWKTNGTAGGTFKLSDFPGGFTFQDLRGSDETSYFSIFSYETFNLNLWKTNGTVASTRELSGEFSNIYDLTDVDGDLFFLGNTVQEPYLPKLWKVTCGSSNIELIKDLSGNPNPGFGGAVSLGDKLFFLGKGDLIPGTDFFNNIIWSSDGTTSGTGPIDDPLLNSLTWITTLIPADNKLFFAAESFQYGNELYVGIFSRKHQHGNDEHMNVAKPNDNLLEKNTTISDRLKIYPNPTTNVITVSFQQQQANDLVITINDQAGRVMMRRKLSAQKGANSVSFNVESLPAGSYIIKFSDRKERVAKFVKE